MDEFDYLVIGGGSSGCVVAGRLSEDPGTSVALLEAGGMGDSWVITTPAAGILTVPTRLHNWAFETEPQPGLNGRQGYQPRGKVLGGSSAINAMVYTRGHRAITTIGRRSAIVVGAMTRSFLISRNPSATRISTATGMAATVH